MTAAPTSIQHLPRRQPVRRASERPSQTERWKVLPLSRGDLPFRNRGVGYLGLKASPTVWPDVACGEALSR